MADLNDSFDKAEDLSKKFDALPGEATTPTTSQYSTLGAGAMGALKGATMGFDDEAIGMAKALYDKGVVGKKENFWDIYSKVRDSMREEHAAAEEQHPVASIAGELAGGIAPLALAPEALVGKGAAEGANIFQKGAELVKGGAKLGAVAGLGASTADLTKGQVGQAATDTLGGAAMGAATGLAMQPVISGVGALAGGAGKIVKSFPIAQEIGNTFKKSTQGLDLLGQQTATKEATQDAAIATRDLIQAARTDTGAKQDLAAQAMTNTGIKVGSQEWLKQNMQAADAALSIAKPEDVSGIREFQDQIKRIAGTGQEEVQTEPGTGQEGVVNPRGAFKQPVVTPIGNGVKTLFNTLTTTMETNPESITPTQINKGLSDLLEQQKANYNKMNPQQGRGIRELYKGARRGLQEALESAPESGVSPDVSDEAKKAAIDQFNEALNTYKIEKGNYKSIAQAQETLSQPGYADQNNKSIPKLQSLIEDSTKPGSDAAQVLKTAFDKLRPIYPEETKNMEDMIHEVATNRDIARGLSAQSPLATNFLHASARAISMQVARLGGLAYGGILRNGSNVARNSSAALTNIGNYIYNASPEMIQGMANKGQAAGGAFGTMIARTLGSLNDAPQSKQRAILFTLMQQPDFRRFAQDFMDEDQSK
jgi:hypothetical protein